MNSLVDHINTEVNELDARKKRMLQTVAAAGVLGGSTLLGLHGLSTKQKGEVKPSSVPSITKPIREPIHVPVERPSVPVKAPAHIKVINMERVASIESSGNPRAVNPKTKARGLHQFMRPTWEEVVKKMGKDWDWDDAFDPDKSTAAANYYMNKNIPAILEAFNLPDTVETRLAAYNWGAGNLRNVYKKYGSEWLEHAPIETKSYIKKYRRLGESIIDYPNPTLSSSIWIKDSGNYFLSEEATDKILDTLHEYPDVRLIGIAKEVHITGSMCTNQYGEDTDIDVHIIPKDLEGINGALQKEVFQYFKNNVNVIDKHPIEVYIQINPAQEYLSDGVYDILQDKWLKGPKIVPLNFDPYEEYSDVADIVRSESQVADKLIGELKRDIIDYDVILNALDVLTGPEKTNLVAKLKVKLQEVESDIQDLAKVKKKWAAARKLASQPTTIEQALKDVQLAKRWRDKNAIFKLLNRYHYMKFISELETMLKSDNELSRPEVGLIQGMMGVDT